MKTAGAFFLQFSFLRFFFYRFRALFFYRFRGRCFTVFVAVFFAVFAWRYRFVYRFRLPFFYRFRVVGVGLKTIKKLSLMLPDENCKKTPLQFSRKTKPRGGAPAPPDPPGPLAAWQVTSGNRSGQLN